MTEPHHFSPRISDLNSMIKTASYIALLNCQFHVTNVLNVIVCKGYLIPFILSSDTKLLPSLGVLHFYWPRYNSNALVNSKYCNSLIDNKASILV